MFYADDMLLLLIAKSIINLVRTVYSIWILIVLKINLDKSIFKLTVMWSIKFEWFALLDFKWSIWQNKYKYRKAFPFALFCLPFLSLPSRRGTKRPLKIEWHKIKFLSVTGTGRIDAVYKVTFTWFLYLSWLPCLVCFSKIVEDY